MAKPRVKTSKKTSPNRSEAAILRELQQVASEALQGINAAYNGCISGLPYIKALVRALIAAGREAEANKLHADYSKIVQATQSIFAPTAAIAAGR